MLCATTQVAAHGPQACAVEIGEGARPTWVCPRRRNAMGILQGLYEDARRATDHARSEEHTSELQSH